MIIFCVFGKSTGTCITSKTKCYTKTKSNERKLNEEPIKDNDLKRGELIKKLLQPERPE